MLDLLLKSGRIQPHAMERFRAMSKIEISLLVIEAGLMPKDCFVNGSAGLIPEPQIKAPQATTVPSSASLPSSAPLIQPVAAVADVPSPSLMAALDPEIPEHIKKRIEADRQREHERLLEEQRKREEIMHRVVEDIRSDSSNELFEPPPAKRGVGRPKKYIDDIEKIEKSMARNMLRVAEYMDEMAPYVSEIKISENVLRACDRLGNSYGRYTTNASTCPKRKTIAVNQTRE